MFSVIKKSEAKKVIGGLFTSQVDVNVNTPWGDYVGSWKGNKDKPNLAKN